MSSTRYVVVIILLASAHVHCQPRKCVQTPPGAEDKPPTDIGDPPLYTLDVYTKSDNKNTFLPDQTYVVILKAREPMRPFKKFMITVEDPAIDNSTTYFQSRVADVGNLKTLDEDLKSRYSDRCSNSVENNDNSDKLRIEMHWVSPKEGAGAEQIRFRAMVAENNEVWYEGLQAVLYKDNAAPVDQPPYEARENCNLNSEARYEVIFKGKWSRGSHSLQFPTKPDEIMYSKMVGASHGFHYTMWARDTEASAGLKSLAEDADITGLEKEIISNMSMSANGTRTLIRGKMHRHPHMHEPSHSLFRVSSTHHLFSLVVALKPSPDWFLGTSRFELCSDDGWLDFHELKLYPWDAGTRNGISYESNDGVTLPRDKVDRVAVGSFDRRSPFYQLNLNDLKPFAMLEVRRLDVYPLEEDTTEPAEKSPPEGEEGEEGLEEPSAAESLMRCDGEWGEWSPCVARDGDCGVGLQTRSRSRNHDNYYNVNPDDLQVRPLERCQLEYQTQSCYKNCI